MGALAGAGVQAYVWPVSLDPSAFSLRWYRDIFTNGMAAPGAPVSWAWFVDSWQHGQWMLAFRNSVFIGFFATLVATALGTVAAIGLSRSEMPMRGTIMSILISPMIVPLVITATGMFFFF